MTTKNLSFVFGALLILSLTIASCSGQGNLTEMSASEMEWEQFSKQIEAVWDSRDVEQILTQYADDCVWEDLALDRVLSGKGEIRSFLNEWFAAFPDTTIEGKFFFASGSHGCSEWVMSGTHSGTFLDMPATGKSFSLRGATVIELSEGKAKRVTDYYDMTTLLKQLEISE